MNTDRVAKIAVSQSLAEIAIGSLVHTLRIPLGGHLLSLNQGFLLTIALKSATGRRDGIATVSAIANSVAILKALSPAGKRLTPMLAISTQGALYAVGVSVLGPTIAGAVLGLMLLSLWGFAQPLLIAWIFFGSTFFEGILKVWTEIARIFSFPHSVLWPLLSTIVALKLAAGAVIAWSAWRSNLGRADAWMARIGRTSRQCGFSTERMCHPAPPPFRGALRDLLNPAFMLSAALSVGFCALSGESGAPAVILYSLRILACALAFFWVARALPRRWIAYALQPFPRLKSVVSEAWVRLSRT